MAFILNNCPHDLGPSQLVLQELCRRKEPVNAGELRTYFGLSAPLDGKVDDVQAALDFLELTGLALHQMDRYVPAPLVANWGTAGREVDGAVARDMLFAVLASGDRAANPSRFVLDVYGYLLVHNRTIVNIAETHLHVAIRQWVKDQKRSEALAANNIDPDQFPNEVKMRHWATVCTYLGMLQRVGSTQFIVRPEPLVIHRYCLSRLRQTPAQRQVKLELMLALLQDLFGIPEGLGWTMGLSRWLQAVSSREHIPWHLAYVPDAGSRYAPDAQGILLRDAADGFNVLALR